MGKKGSFFKNFFNTEDEYEYVEEVVEETDYVPPSSKSSKNP